MPANTISNHSLIIHPFFLAITYTRNTITHVRIPIPFSFVLLIVIL